MEPLLGPSSSGQDHLTLLWKCTCCGERVHGGARPLDNICSQSYFFFMGLLTKMGSVWGYSFGKQAL